MRALKGLALPRTSHSGEIAMAGARHLCPMLTSVSIIVVCSAGTVKETISFITPIDTRECCDCSASPRPRRWINSISYATGECVYPRARTIAAAGSISYASYFEQANEVLRNVTSERIAKRLAKDAVGAPGLLTTAGEELRWFAVPGDTSALRYVLI